MSRLLAMTSHDQPAVGARRRPLPRLLLHGITTLAISAVAALVSQVFDAQPVNAAEASRPNIVLIVADDLGYGDLGCYGHQRIQTPNLDRFAAGGLRLTSCYAAAANCSPARAGLMTGRTPFRAGIFNWIPMHSPMHLRRSEITVAKLLQQAGYDTGHVGKWHLNGQFNRPGQPQPDEHGFAHWFSTQNNALPNHRNPHNFVRNGKPAGRLEGYSAELVAAEAIRWLQDVRDRRRPFFLFVCFHEPHEPIASAERFTKLYPSDDPSLSAHHGNITQMDHAFGRIVDALERLELRDSTLMFFTSDNGPARTSIHPHGSAGPLRGKKGYLYEGGIRVPGILQWPGRIRPGSVSDVPVSGVDLLPTACEIAGIEPPGELALDGTSLVPLFDEKPLHRTRPLYWQFNRARGEAKVALRAGAWKLLARLDVPSPKPSGGIAPGEMEALKTARPVDFELYNLEDDIAEQHDLSERRANVLQRLKTHLEATYFEVQREAPTWPVWEFARYEAQRIGWPEYRNRPDGEKNKTN